MALYKYWAILGSAISGTPRRVILDTDKKKKKQFQPKPTIGKH